MTEETPKQTSTVVFATTNHPPNPLYVNGIFGGRNLEGMVNLTFYSQLAMPPTTVKVNKETGGYEDAMHQAELQAIFQTTIVTTTRNAKLFADFIYQQLGLIPPEQE